MNEYVTETFYDPELAEDVTYYKPEYVQHLHKRIQNQRKQLNSQNDQIADKKAKIEDLSASLSFTDAKNNMIADELDDANADKGLAMKRNDYLEKRLRSAEKSNKMHLGKLMALKHVMDRDEADEDTEADDILDAMVSLR